MSWVKKGISVCLIYIAYFLCRVATWVDPTEAPEDGWD